MKAIALLIAVTAGCYSPSYTNCALTCATSQTCPSGLECVAGVCKAPGESCVVAGDGGVDGNVDDSLPDAGPYVPWGSPTEVVLQLAGVILDDPSLRDDLLEGYFNYNNTDIARTSRTTTMAAWTNFGLVSELDTNFNNRDPDISGDGLQIVFARDDAQGNFDLHIAYRGSTMPGAPNAVFGAAQAIAPLNGNPSIEGGPALSKDKLAIVFHSTRTGGSDIYMATRTSAQPTIAWSAPMLLANINDPTHADEGPYLSADQLTIYFASHRTGSGDLYYATRESKSDPFGAPQPITELNTASQEDDPWVSADGKEIFFARTPMGGSTSIWRATR